jgi:hypothetical protein
MDKTVTLFCQAGQHEWQRPSQRGRRPLNCPNCAPDADAPAAAPEPRPACPAELRTYLDCEPRTEDARVLQYIARELDRGTREDSDVRMLLDTARDRIRRAA